VPDREILKLLPSTLGREAITYAGPLTRGTLDRRMGIRLAHDKYFELEEIEAQDGGGKRYRRRKVLRAAQIQATKPPSKHRPQSRSPSCRIGVSVCSGNRFKDGLCGLGEAQVAWIYSAP